MRWERSVVVLLGLVLDCGILAAEGNRTRLSKIDGFATKASLVAMTATTGGLIYAAVHDRPFGTSLWRWAPGQEKPVVVDELAGAGFRIREGELVYLRQTPTGARLATLNPVTGKPGELATPEFSPSALRYAFPDGDTLVLRGHVATPAVTGAEPVDSLHVYTLHSQSASPLPLPTDCGAAELAAVMGPTQAVVSCPDKLVVSTFAGALRLTSDLEAGSGMAPLAMPASLDPGWDGYWGPILALGRGGVGPPFRLLRLGPPHLLLPPDAEVGAVFHRPDEDLLIVQQVLKGKPVRNYLARPFAGRSSSMPATGALTGTPVHWSSKELALWQEGAALVIADTKHLRPIARAEITAGTWPVPGTHQGERLPVAMEREGAIDLLWFKLDRMTPVFTLAAGGLSGRPLAAFSASGQKGCYVVMTRTEGPGLDLIRMEER